MDAADTNRLAVHEEKKKMNKMEVFCEAVLNNKCTEDTIIQDLIINLTRKESNPTSTPALQT